MEGLDAILASSEAEPFEIEHKGETYKFSKKEISWTRKNKILSRCISYSGNSASVDLDAYNRTMLLEMLVDTPWPSNETRQYLERLGSSFGNKLAEYVPSPFDTEEDDDQKKD